MTDPIHRINIPALKQTMRNTLATYRYHQVITDVMTEWAAGWTTKRLTKKMGEQCAAYLQARLPGYGIKVRYFLHEGASSRWGVRTYTRVVLTISSDCTEDIGFDCNVVYRENDPDNRLAIDVDQMLVSHRKYARYADAMVQKLQEVEHKANEFNETLTKLVALSKFPLLDGSEHEVLWEVAKVFSYYPLVSSLTYHTETIPDPVPDFTPPQPA